MNKLKIEYDNPTNDSIIVDEFSSMLSKTYEIAKIKDLSISGNFYVLPYVIYMMPLESLEIISKSKNTFCVDDRLISLELKKLTLLCVHDSKTNTTDSENSLEENHFLFPQIYLMKSLEYLTCLNTSKMDNLFELSDEIVNLKKLKSLFFAGFNSRRRVSERAVFIPVINTDLCEWSQEWFFKYGDCLHIYNHLSQEINMNSDMFNSVKHLTISEGDNSCGMCFFTHPIFIRPFITKIYEMESLETLRINSEKALSVLLDDLDNFDKIPTSLNKLYIKKKFDIVTKSKPYENMNFFGFFSPKHADDLIKGKILEVDEFVDYDTFHSFNNPVVYEMFEGNTFIKSELKKIKNAKEQFYHLSTEKMDVLQIMDVPHIIKKNRFSEPDEDGWITVLK